MRHRLPPALRVRGFALLWTALLTNGFATQMMVVAIGWQVYSIRHRPLDLGLVGLAEFLPLPLLALPAGQLADRVSRRSVAAVAAGLQVGIALILLAITAVGPHSIWPFLGVGLLAGITSAIGTPAQRSLTPELVPSELLAGAIALRSVASQIGVVAGPAVGGLIFAIEPLAVYAVAKDSLPAFLQLPYQTVDSGLKRVTGSIGDLLWKAVYVFMIWGSIDLFRQQRRFTQEMRMSKQEVREEAKESEGNPQIKSRIRRIQRDLARRNMMKEIPKSTAIIVNPTHYAGNIRYDLDSMAAPKVVAKGADLVAQRIMEIARNHGVPVVEKKPLAQALYKTVKIGQAIPLGLYLVVAELMAYVYRLRADGTPISRERNGE